MNAPLWRIVCGDALARLRELPEASVQCCVTSPPYWGLRDYGVAGQLGLEATPAEYVARLVDVFRQVRRVLRDDGVAWINLGDCYAATAGGGQGGKNSRFLDRTAARIGIQEQKIGKIAGGLKPKDLVGIPWTVAFALRADGWWLRSEIIWHKPAVMPESVTDRPTKAHEQVFLLAKSERYYYDADAIAEPAVEAGRVVDYTGDQQSNAPSIAYLQTRPKGRKITVKATRNRRSVWTVASQPFAGAHFAVMPRALVEPCILAGSRVGDLVLDPFSGAGTVALEALRLQRRAIGIELNPEYVAMSCRRIEADAPLLNRRRA